MSRRLISGLIMVGVALLAEPYHPTGRPPVVWNATASEPLGFYRVQPLLAARVGDLVLLRPDAASVALYAARGYLPAGVPLLKPVAATPGMRVCERDGRLTINGKLMATALPADGRGRPMAAWRGCGALADGELFVLNPAVPTSLDGRYFGPSPMRAVLGQAVPVWTWGRR